MHVSIFCGTGAPHTPHLAAEISLLAQHLAAQRAKVRMGGMARGVMNMLGRALLTNGVPLEMVYPQNYAADAAVPPHPLLTHHAVVNLAARLKVLGESPFILILPGGLGTWHELMDAWTALRPGQRILVLNHADFYAPLRQQLELGATTGYLHPKRLAQIEFYNTVDALIGALPA